MKALIKFVKGILGSPLHLQLWMGLLLALNLVSPIVFFERLEARVVLVTLAACLTLMTVFTGRSGYTRLLSAGHVFWIPLLIWLWTRLDHIPPEDAFGIWIRLLILVDAICLAIDGVEVVRYIAGRREELVDGL